MEPEGVKVKFKEKFNIEMESSFKLYYRKYFQGLRSHFVSVFGHNISRHLICSKEICLYQELRIVICLKAAWFDFYNGIS